MEKGLIKLNLFRNSRNLSLSPVASEVSHVTFSSWWREGRTRCDEPACQILESNKTNDDDVEQPLLKLVSTLLHKETYPDCEF